ncbi:PilZ domain-containing protein [Desulfosarcina sp.]|uniref:PilZ domain-containing protein n=1 Tax=Desulfosarcina sp. TaxID=2027861 RepID=UPI0039706B91
MKIERRKHPRHLMAGKDVFVMDQCSGKVAMLRDLSTSGMQLSYPPDQSTCNQWTLIDIFAGEQAQILLSGLTCKMVYDVASLLEDGSFTGTDVRLCGVRFNGLKRVQKENLDKLMEGAAAS